MEIVIKKKNLELTPELKAYIEEKIGDLEIFLQDFEREKENKSPRKRRPRVLAEAEVGKVTCHHQKGNIFRSEVQIKILGRIFRAEAERDNLKAAIAEVKDELQVQLKKYKGKISDFKN